MPSSTRRRKMKSRRSRRRRQGGSRLNRSSNEETAYMRELVARTSSASTTAELHNVYDMIARFLLHSTHIVRNEGFRATAIQKLNQMLALTTIPAHTRSTAEEALARLEAM